MFDLPETVRDETTFPPALEFVAGDVFERVPRGNTYVTSGIIRDRDDERAAAILRTVSANAESGARRRALLDATGFDVVRCENGLVEARCR